MARLKLVSRLYQHLLRRLWLVLACATLALAPAAPSPIQAKDASALSIAAPRAPEQVRSVTSRPAPASWAAAQAKREFHAATGFRRSAGREAPRGDGRYLYLELVTLLS